MKNFLILISLLIFIAATYAGDFFTPDVGALGQQVGPSLALFSLTEKPKDGVYPEEVALVIKHGQIIEIRAQYSKEVKFIDIETQMEKQFGDWSLKLVKTVPLRIWKVTPRKIVVQLGMTEDGKVLLSYVQMVAK